MSESKNKPTKDTLYNKKRKPILRVEATTADSEQDIQDMEKMKGELILKSGTAKKGVIDMYVFAKNNGYFDNV